MGAYHVAMRQRVEEEFVGVMNAVEPSSRKRRAP